MGINDNAEWNNYYKIDLSMGNYELIEQLSKLPKPDIIVASPPCESWSIADNSRRAYRTSTSNTIIVYNYNDYVRLNNEGKLKRDYFRQQRKRIMGESTIMAAMYIIETFKPSVWVIENPRTSKIWEYIENFKGEYMSNAIENNTNYNCYDNENFTKKPTRFLSNIDLDLRNYSVKADKKWGHFNNGQGYDISSSIPYDLILGIYQKIKGE